MQGEHLFPRKNVIRQPILREISILYGADPDLFRDVGLFVLTQLRIFFLDDFPCALARLFEKVAQRDVFAGARLH